jgi:hypothetical protein
MYSPSLYSLGNTLSNLSVLAADLSAKPQQVSPCFGGGFLVAREKFQPGDEQPGVEPPAAAREKK